jgi:hypothetical protein
MTNDSVSCAAGTRMACFAVHMDGVHYRQVALKLLESIRRLHSRVFGTGY